MREKIINYFTGLFGIFFAVIVFNIVFLNSNTQFKYNMNTAIIIFMAMLIGIIMIYYIYTKFIYKLDKRLKACMHALLWIVILIFQIVIVKNSYFKTDWDCGQMILAAINLVDSPEKFDIGYFKMFPNNVFLVWIYKNIYIISKYLKNTNYQQLLCIVNVLFVDLGIIITTFTSKEIFGKKVSVITEVFSIIMLAFMPWILIPYTDTYSAFCGVLVLYIYLKLLKQENNKLKVIYSLLIGTVLLLGFQIKPTTIIVIIAIFIAHILFRINSKQDLFRFVIHTIIIVCTFITAKFIYTNTISNIVIDGNDVRDNYKESVPMTHFFMMGLQSQETENGYTYGCWSSEDYQITLGRVGKDEKVKANIEEIERRLKGFGIVGYAKFIYNKVNWILSDGNFYYGGEGTFEVFVPSNGTKLSEEIQSYYLKSGVNYTRTAHINQGSWLMVIILLIISSFRKDNDYERKVDTFIIRLTIVGILLFLVLFEARSRYLINHLSFFVILASYGFYSLCVSCNSVYKGIKNNLNSKRYILE